MLNFKEANKNVLWILLVGIALGVANYSLGIWSTLGQSMVQQVVISFVIGYGLLMLVYNSSQLFTDSSSNYKKYGILVLGFVGVGILGTEVQSMSNALLFQQGNYSPLNGGGTYLFNSILSCILGFSILTLVKDKGESQVVVNDFDAPAETPRTPLTSIPIRKGEATFLHLPEDVIYFEAYDNYSFLHDREGNRHLCSYPLVFLEKRLSENFLRVHRKYLINRDHIHQIKPHLKGRFVIEFTDKTKKSIVSSSGYSEVIKSLIRL